MNYIEILIGITAFILWALVSARVFLVLCFGFGKGDKDEYYANGKRCYELGEIQSAYARNKFLRK